MKTTLITLLLLPFLSFGQVSEEDQISIDDYAISMCGCINDLINDLHPKTMGVIILMAEEGEEVAMIEVEEMLTEMSQEEMEFFLESFSKMESEAFLAKVENCDEASGLNDGLEDQINSDDGDVFNYFMEVLNREETCKIVKVLYDLGNATEE